MLNVSIGFKALFCDSVNQAYRLHLRTVVENLMNITDVFHFMLKHSTTGRREKKVYLWIKGQR